MRDAAPTGQPRLVSLVDELRMMGAIAMAVTVCAVGWWLTAWVLGRDVRPYASAAAAVIGVIAGVAALGLPARRRVRHADRTLPPPRGSLFETRAASEQRRIRMAATVLLGVVALLAFDRYAREGGELSALVAGVFAGVALVSLWEARVWARRQRDDGVVLHILVAPRATMAALGSREVYERSPRPPRDDPPGPFDLPRL